MSLSALPDLAEGSCIDDLRISARVRAAEIAGTRWYCAQVTGGDEGGAGSVVQRAGASRSGCC